MTRAAVSAGGGNVRPCRQRFSTTERPILATPLIIKRDGTREEFDRDKLMRGIRIACVKRPVSPRKLSVWSVKLNPILQQVGRSEVSSRIIGDKVIERLKNMDLIAYIRYAIVYLQLDDLHEIRNEIDHLLEGEG